MTKEITTDVAVVDLYVPIQNAVIAAIIYQIIIAMEEEKNKGRAMKDADKHIKLARLSYPRVGHSYSPIVQPKKGEMMAAISK